MCTGFRNSPLFRWMAQLKYIQQAGIEQQKQKSSEIFGVRSAEGLVSKWQWVGQVLAPGLRYAHAGHGERPPPADAGRGGQPGCVLKAKEAYCLSHRQALKPLLSTCRAEKEKDYQPVCVPRLGEGDQELGQCHRCSVTPDYLQELWVSLSHVTSPGTKGPLPLQNWLAVPLKGPRVPGPSNTPAWVPPSPWP